MPKFRENHENRVIGDHTSPLADKFPASNHYEVTHFAPTGQTYQGPYGHPASVTSPKTQYFGDRKSAKQYGKSVADLGYDVYVQKHDKSSQDAGYTKGKTDKLMETGLSVRKFLKGN